MCCGLTKYQTTCRKFYINWQVTAYNTTPFKFFLLASSEHSFIPIVLHFVGRFVFNAFCQPLILRLYEYYAYNSNSSDQKIIYENCVNQVSNINIYHTYIDRLTNHFHFEIYVVYNSEYTRMGLTAGV